MRTRLVLQGVGLLLLSMRAGAQTTVYAVAPVTATIAAPGSAGEAEDLEGEVAAKPGSGEVVVDPAHPGKGAPIRPAAYRVAGRRDAAFALALPDNQECTLVAPGATIKVKEFKVSVAGGPSTSRLGGLTLDPDGGLKFKVGATLEMASGLPPNHYVGNFKVTLGYN
jgi:hypothetical protein